MNGSRKCVRTDILSPSFWLWYAQVLDRGNWTCLSSFRTFISSDLPVGAGFNWYGNIREHHGSWQTSQTICVSTTDVNRGHRAAKTQDQLRSERVRQGPLITDAFKEEAAAVVGSCHFVCCFPEQLHTYSHPNDTETPL